MININKNIKDISNYFEDDILNIVYHDLELNKNNNFNLELEKNKNFIRSEEEIKKINIFELKNFLVGSIGYTTYELDKKNISYDTVKILSNDYNSDIPTYKIVYLLLIFDNDKLLGLQVANEKNIEARLEAGQKFLFDENALKELSTYKVYKSTDEFNPDILNISALTARSKNQGNNNKEVDSKDIETLVKNKDFILDVREEDEFSMGHIKGAVNIPLRELFSKREELPKNKNIYIHMF